MDFEAVRMNAPKPRAGIAPIQGVGIAPIQGAGIASISAGDRSIVSTANAKNGKSQESSFFPATFRHSLFVKL
ncbi:MAG: hypothetical protein ACLVC5_04525 [Clostridia bacterium]